ncbi:hypothetical protein RND71_032763 [Anisodus tanguticus]|uniref:Uncharacterized protein n=1 Tax=Anisodus tanguticus TaxID=243964 RepID=A0AAE1R6I5_9SOLA|nr:hypothetical protein RND71_032763 [Anisodus tanguticus]
MEGIKETVVPKFPINESLHETVEPEAPINEATEKIVVAAEQKTPPINRPAIVLPNSPIKSGNTPERLKVPKPFKYPERFKVYNFRSLVYVKVRIADARKFFFRNFIICSC